MPSLWKQPSAWVPMALSLGILAMLIITLASMPVIAREPDEGTQARLFQLWLLLEFLLIPYFALTWLPRAPRAALPILAVQLALVFAAAFPVFYFQL